MGVVFCCRGHTWLGPILPFRIVLPNAGNRESTLRTGAILDAIPRHIVPGALYQPFFALGTIGVRTIAVDISFIDIPQAHVERDLPCMVKRLGRRPWLVPQLEVRVKRSEMQRHVRT